MTRHQVHRHLEIKIFIALSLLALWCGLSASHAEMSLTNKGTSQARIILPSTPSDMEAFAAEEIKRYLHKISGADIPIIHTDRIDKEPAIIIGHHPAAQPILNELDKRHPGDYDRLAVVVRGNRLYLTGHCQSAIVWAAWDWLESLGVRWFFPGQMGEYVPKIDSITLPDSEKYDAPRMVFRGPNYALSQQWVDQYHFPDGAVTEEHGVPASTLFTWRLRLNNNTAPNIADCIPSVGSGHSYTQFLPPSRYHEDHPEWFNLIDGRRLSERPWQVCFTSKDAARQFAENIMSSIRIFEKKGIPPERMRLFVSPNDWNARCECEHCRKLIDNEDRASSLVLHFANLVAGEIRKTYPGAHIVYYVYDNYGRIPEHEVPGPGVSPEIVFWTLGTGTAANHAHPMFSDANERYREVFTWFAENSTAISAHTYYGHYFWFTPWPKLTQMATDLPTMAAFPSFYGMYSQSHHHYGTQGLNFYLQAKLMWNPDLDVQHLVNDYCDKAFGPAGLAIRSYYMTLQESMDQIDYIGGNVIEIPELLTPEMIADCNRLMDTAESHLPAMDPGSRWRTNLVIQAWRASAKVGEALNLLRKGSGPEDQQRILNLADEVLAFAKTETGRWAFENRMLAATINTLTQGLRPDLDALPPGQHQWSSGFMHGGAVPFQGSDEGFYRDLWGFSLPPNGRGSLELPLQAIDGHQITRASIQWSGLTGAHARSKAVRATAVKNDGKEITLAQDAESASKLLEVPPEAFPCKKITFRIEVQSRHSDTQIVLTSAAIKATVE